ncbi:MAG: alpha/beta fold hydrolase [Anaerolineales bacterium]|nr:alpha/beta fold hydrolase [Anaerolineales bacterium]
MIDFEERVYTVGEQQIHTMEAGRRGRQIALMIHGWSSSWYAMSPLMGLLAQRFHCISVDLPGYGQSPPFNKSTTIPDYVDVLAELIEQVSSDPVVLVGHSMGGMISITLALTYPVLVERMVLLSPTISGRLSTAINFLISPITVMERFRPGSVLVRAIENTVVGITDRLMRPVSFAERSGITADAYMRLRADARRPGQGKVRAECFTAMRENDLSGRLGSLETPTLIVWGAEDNTVPLRDAGVVADEWPQADLRILPKAGHWPHFETPDTTRRQVAAYLGLPRTSSELYTPVDDAELVRVQEVAQFLAHSDIGSDLNQAQRIRIAAQLQRLTFGPGEPIVHASEEGHELYLIETGEVEVWKDPEGLDPEMHEHARVQHVTTFAPGRIVGEFAMLDQGGRSADLLAGPEGATVLTLDRERLLTLCEDDAVLGTRLLWNIATVIAKRARFILWQLNRAEQRRMSRAVDEREMIT